MKKPPLIVERAELKHVPHLTALSMQEMDPVIQVAWRGSFEWDEWVVDLKEAINDFILEKVHVYLFPKNNSGEVFAFTWITLDNQSLWIDAIVIDRFFQRRGYGTYILEWLIDNLAKPNKIGKLQLGVQKNNEAGLAFYEKHGFREISFIDAANTHILEKKLSIAREKPFFSSFI
ncbi:MAG: GNAT family N-acetyltransferase [Candidatus Hodarchaeales archaeon]